MTNKNTPLPSTSKIPTKWLAVAVFVLVGYGLTQPFVNRKFGWTLPSLASVLGFEDKAAKQKPEAPADSKRKQSSGTQSEDTSDMTLSAEQLESQLLGETGDNDSESGSKKSNKTETLSSTQSTKPADTKKDSSKLDSSKQSTSKQSSAKQNSNQQNPKPSDATSPPKGNSKSDPNLLYGLLKDVGREEYVSPAGLRYTRGSEEGHRLKHIERHLADIPDRPGRHGVFEGDMAGFLRLLDEAYTRAEKGEKGTSKTEDGDGMLKYEVTFPKPIGFIGGRDGARQKNPDAKRLRMILADDRVITAFPF